MKSGYSHQYFTERDTLDPMIAESISHFAKSKNIKRILDVGCGTGKLVKFLNSQGFKTLGCDASRHAISLAKEINSAGTITKAEATHLPYKNSSFDLVLAISLIEHLNKKDAKKFLKETRRILDQNGHIFLVTPNFISPARFIFGKNWFGYKDPTHINFFSSKSLAQLLNQEGFENPRIAFKVNFKKIKKSFFPEKITYLPKPILIVLAFLFYQTPFALFRDSFWMAAQKSATSR